MPTFAKGDTVRVVRLTFGWHLKGRKPRVGETATIRYFLKGVETLYLAERIGADGAREWLCEFAPDDLELVEP
jgi:hypothetical protein